MIDWAVMPLPPWVSEPSAKLGVRSDHRAAESVPPRGVTFSENRYLLF
jgi:hypothetical protein